MDIFIPIFIFFTIFIFCALCGFCCRKRRNDGAIFSTPVVVTSETHHVATGPYPVSVAPNINGHTIIQPTYQPVQSSMPYPQQQVFQPALYQQGQQQFGATPYPTGNASYPMPQQAPYPGAYPPQQPQPQGYQAPYPANDQFGLAGGNAPYPTAGPVMNPPSYDQVRNDNAYQKQSPYNPNFTG